MRHSERYTIENIILDHLKELHKAFDPHKKRFEEMELYSYRRDERRYSWDYDYLKRLHVQIEYLEGLLEYFEDLRKKKVEQKYETYDEVKLQFLLDNLPQNLADRIRGGLRKDDRRMRQQREQKLEEEKKVRIDHISSLNANNEFKYNYQSNTPFVIQKFKGKIKSSQQNRSQTKINRDVYSDIINWMEKSFVSTYSSRIGDTYYTKGKDTMIDNPTYAPNSDELEKFTKEMEKELITPLITKVEELLNLDTIPYDIREKLEKYLDLLKEQAKISLLIELVSNIDISQPYSSLKEEITNAFHKLRSEKAKIDISIEKMKSKVNIDEIHEKYEDDIESKKKSDRLNEERKKDNNKIKPNNDEDRVAHDTGKIEEANRKYEEDFIEEQIKYLLGRTPTEEDKRTDKYRDAKMKAEVHARIHIRDLNTDISNYIIEYLSQQLEQIKSEVGNKKFGEKTDPRIVELQEKIEGVKNTWFPNYYKIIDLINYRDLFARDLKSFKEVENFLKR